jgi:hypothetical protein
MASKRDLKKYIRFVCGDVAGECLVAECSIKSIDSDKMKEVIVKLANLQEDCLDKVNVSFDKNLKSFGNDKKEFVKARSAYYKACYNAVIEQLNNGIEDVVKDMNAILPEDQKEANKEIAAKE